MKLKEYTPYISTIIMVMIFYLDYPLANFISINSFKVASIIFSMITEIGSFSFIALINLLIVIILISKIKFLKNQKEKYKKQLILMFYAILIQSGIAIFIQILKFIFGRIRPYYYITDINYTLKNSFTFFNYNSDFVSFPSGHSSGIWSLIVCIILVFNIKNECLKFSLITLATLISISRLILNMHYLSDIVVGGFIGVFFSYILMKKALALKQI